jgi:CubicO group peptidase (beta-lactamase class C family)
MNKQLLAGLIGLCFSGISHANVTFHSEDKAMLKNLAPYGISQKNWDASELVSMTYLETHRFSEHARIAKSTNPRTFEASDKSLDLSSIQVHDIDGYGLSLEDLLRDRLNVRSMVVLQDGKLVYEDYWSGTNKDTLQLSMSVGKSFTSSLMAIAQDEGYIKFSDPVEKWLPEAKGTVIGTYPLQYVSDMRSGFALIDDDPNLFGDDWDTSMEEAISWHGHSDTEWVGIKDYAPHLTKLSYKQGEKYEYHSFNTEVLGVVTQRAVGKHWTEYFYEKIWDKGQFTSETTVMVDREKTVIACGTLSMTNRDHANMGDIWAHDGRSQNGTQVVPADWLNAVWEGNDEVRAAWAKGKEAALAEGFYKDQFRVLNLGGEQWLTAVGVNGQIIAVERQSKTVIALFSSYNVPSSACMAVGFFHTAIPAIKAAIK